MGNEGAGGGKEAIRKKLGTRERKRKWIPAEDRPVKKVKTRKRQPVWSAAP
jgi:hypothetical protein